MRAITLLNSSSSDALYYFFIVELLDCDNSILNIKRIKLVDNKIR